MATGMAGNYYLRDVRIVVVANPPILESPPKMPCCAASLRSGKFALLCVTAKRHRAGAGFRMRKAVGSKHTSPLTSNEPHKGWVVWLNVEDIFSLTDIVLVWLRWTKF